jgi:hypothetical protein
LNYILWGLFFAFLVINAVAHWYLYRSLKHYDPSLWAALGSPEFKVTKRSLTGINSMRDERRFTWDLLTLKYR